MIKIEVWPRADGWTEIEGMGHMARFKTRAEADAHVSGIRAGLTIARNLAIREWDIEDRRPIEAAPTPPPEPRFTLDQLGQGDAL